MSTSDLLGHENEPERVTLYFRDGKIVGAYLNSEHVHSALGDTSGVPVGYVPAPEGQEPKASSALLTDADESGGQRSEGGASAADPSTTCPHGLQRPAQYWRHVCPCCGFALDATQHCGTCGEEPVEIRVVPEGVSVCYEPEDVERVARALNDRWGAGSHGCRWDLLGDVEREYWRDAADVALKAALPPREAGEATELEECKALYRTVKTLQDRYWQALTDIEGWESWQRRTWREIAQAALRSEAHPREGSGRG